MRRNHDRNTKLVQTRNTDSILTNFSINTPRIYKWEERVGIERENNNLSKSSPDLSRSTQFLTEMISTFSGWRKPLAEHRYPPPSSWKKILQNSGDMLTLLCCSHSHLKCTKFTSIYLLKISNSNTSLNLIFQKVLYWEKADVQTLQATFLLLFAASPNFWYLLPFLSHLPSISICPLLS